MALTKSGAAFAVLTVIFSTFILSRFYYLRSSESEIKFALQRQEKEVKDMAEKSLTSNFDEKISIEQLAKSEAVAKYKKCEKDIKAKVTQCDKEKADLKADQQAALSSSSEAAERSVKTCQSNLAKLKAQTSSTSGKIESLEADQAACNNKLLDASSSARTFQEKYEAEKLEKEKLLSKSKQISSAKKILDTEVENLKIQLEQANAEIEHASLANELSENPNAEAAEDADSEYVMKLKDGYNAQLKNMKNHYEAQLSIANEKIRELFTDRQAKVDALNKKMRELKSHIEHYTQDLVNNSFGVDDFDIKVQEFNYQS